MLPKLGERCNECNGYGIEWNETFDRAMDRAMDTQGLSFYEAAEQTKKSRHYKSDYWDCESCNGTGKAS